MNSFLILTIFACLYTSTSAYQLRPSSLNSALLKTTVCYDERIDESASPSIAHQNSYFGCAKDEILHISKCTLRRAKENECPLQTTDTAEIFDLVCTDGSSVDSNDCTEIIKARCDSQNSCIFEWVDTLTSLDCATEPSEISYKTEAIDLAYKCIGTKLMFRPFSNKRFNNKFSRNMKHPMRKLSFNRLRAL